MAFILDPSMAPASLCPSSLTQYIGPWGKSVLLFFHSSTVLSWGSSCGMSPNPNCSWPPYFLGMLTGSMKDSSVFFMSCELRMNILEVVIGSNHFLIQPHTVGKNAGAPIIWEGLVYVVAAARDESK